MLVHVKRLEAWRFAGRASTVLLQSLPAMQTRCVNVQALQLFLEARQAYLRSALQGLTSGATLQQTQELLVDLSWRIQVDTAGSGLHLHIIVIGVECSIGGHEVSVHGLPARAQVQMPPAIN